MKDIFIDNNVASRFKNPADEEYKKLLNWITEKGHLVLSQKLLKEYISVFVLVNNVFYALDVL